MIAGHRGRSAAALALIDTQLEREQPCEIGELMAATGWQAHSVRARPDWVPKSLNSRLTMNKIASRCGVLILPRDDRTRRHAQLDTHRLLHGGVCCRDGRPRPLPDPPTSTSAWAGLTERAGLR